jgi:hypothetical protein
MKRLGAFINPCSGQDNMFVANGAKRETGADEHIAPRGIRMKSDGPAITLAHQDRMKEQIEFVTARLKV